LPDVAFASVAWEPCVQAKSGVAGVREFRSLRSTTPGYGHILNSSMKHTDWLRRSRPRAAVVEATGAGATAVAALAALAAGSVTIGLLVISRVIIRDLLVKQMHLRRLKIDQLDVADLRVSNLTVLKEQKPSPDSLSP
jgi:hypothetical protein